MFSCSPLHDSVEPTKLEAHGDGHAAEPRCCFRHVATLDRTCTATSTNVLFPGCSTYRVCERGTRTLRHAGFGHPSPNRKKGESTWSEAWTGKSISLAAAKLCRITLNLEGMLGRGKRKGSGQLTTTRALVVEGKCRTRCGGGQPGDAQGYLRIPTAGACCGPVSALKHSPSTPVRGED